MNFRIIIVEEKRAFLSGLTLKSDMLVNQVIDRWRTTLKLATKREYIAQWCYCSLFKFTRSNGWELKLLDILMNIVIMSET